MRNYKLYLMDIADAITKIQSFVKNSDFNAFRADARTYDSVLHNLLVIGEAANKIPRETQDEYTEVDWSGYIGMRNIIAHGYFNINPEIVWKTIQEDIPILHKQILEIINK